MTIFNTLRVNFLSLFSIVIIASCVSYPNSANTSSFGGDKKSYEIEARGIQGTQYLKFYTDGTDYAESNFFSNLDPSEREFLIKSARSHIRMLSLMQDVMEVPFGDFQVSFAVGYTNSPAVYATTRYHLEKPIVILNPVKLGAVGSDENMSILAHEIAHHYLRHDLGQCSKENELEADQFAGVFFGLIKGTEVLRNIPLKSVEDLMHQRNEIFRVAKSEQSIIPSHFEGQVETRCHPSLRNRELWFMQGKVEGLFLSLGYPRELLGEFLGASDLPYIVNMVQERN